MPWRYYFRIINLSNIVIEGLGGRDNVPSHEEYSGKKLQVEF